MTRSKSQASIASGSSSPTSRSTISNSNKSRVRNIPSRHQNKWGIPELLRLNREYELLEMDIQEIAQLHGRTEISILNMLEKEGYIGEWSEARGYTEDIFHI